MRALLIATSMALASCAAPASVPAAPDDLLHYQVHASIESGGELSADVTVSVPAGSPEQMKFILGRRFELAAPEVSAEAQVEIAETDQPVAGLTGITVRFSRPVERATQLRFRYHGPIFASESQDRLGYTPDCIEMALELMWLPFIAEVNRRFSVEATLEGIAEDMTVVAQGEVRREGGRVHVSRRAGDLDFAWVAARGLKRVEAPGLELYARDLEDPLVRLVRKHALEAARFHQEWFGPLPDGPIRLAVVPRKNGGAYARAGYTIIPEGRASGEPAPELSEIGRANGVAHEFAHAWWAPADPFSEDYWLAESIAQYAAWRYLEAKFGKDVLAADIERARAGIADAGPVLGRGRPSRLVLYTKGPLLLRDLERRIGRAALDTVLARLARRPPRKTAEFLSMLAEVAGSEAARTFEEELRRESPPVAAADGLPPP